MTEWEAAQPAAGLVRLRRSLQLRCGPDRAAWAVGRRLALLLGQHSGELRGWVEAYCRVRAARQAPDSNYYTVRATWSVFRPRPGLELEVSFLRREGGAAVCRAQVRRPRTFTLTCT
jgi:hypothetical protein